MALASSCVLLHHRSFAFSRSSISKTPIRRTIVPITFKIESVNRCNSALPNIRCCSSSGSSVEAEKYSSTRIFIKGLPLSMSEGCLMKSFSCYGEVRKVKIITDRKSRQSLGLAYVWFASEESAQLAVAEMDGKVHCRYNCKA
ncbi:PREDICTED: glycine-rich RNA-binding protein 4, mitochondrial isoform X2 [Nelumbo nucifera]|uniref:Glycine-rich RNA-binding protein 4, mitochondrial isoform X2 n=1 Tax=Nelumbo nucifera TaxID=4432 RepID=A0A1U8BB31_NELNU|nr:PREDICTED: glycine-rich RNA-binding protein 4, mitochondrial isoform X2 [Nelumbo nucifera]